MYIVMCHFIKNGTTDFYCPITPGWVINRKVGVILIMVQLDSDINWTPHMMQSSQKRWCSALSFRVAL